MANFQQRARVILFLCAGLLVACSQGEMNSGTPTAGGGGGTTPPANPSVTLTANPTSVASGASSTLTWSSSNATSCTASGAWSGAKATAGSEPRTNLTATGTYTLTCNGNGGSASRSVTVTVTGTGGAAGGGTLYVDGAVGDDAVSYAENSAARPWRTLGRAVWGSTSRAAPNAGQAARAGDVVLVAPGVYNTGEATNSRYTPIYQPVNNGTSGNPVTFRSQQRGQAELRSSLSAGTQPILGALNNQHIVWDGFLLDEQHIPTRSDTGPVVVWGSSHVTIQNMEIRGYDWGWRDNHNAIRAEYADQVVIRNNRLSGYNTHQHEQAIEFYETGQALVEHNEIHDAMGAIFVKGRNTGPFIIRNNLIHDVRGGIGIGGLGTSAGSAGAIVYRNIVYSAWAGIWFISYDSVSPANVVVANNTLVSADGADGGALLFRTGTAGYRDIRAHNNILASSQSGVTVWDGAMLGTTTFSHNSYFANTQTVTVNWQGYSFGAWQAAFNKDVTGSVAADPQFVNPAGHDYRLGAGSPLRHAGLDVLDLNGNGSVSDAVHIGAYATGDEVIGRID